MQYLKIKNATKKGYLKAYPGDGVDLRYPSSKLRRGRVQHKMAQTVQCDNGGGGVVVEVNNDSRRNTEKPSAEN